MEMYGDFEGIFPKICCIVNCLGRYMSHVVNYDVLCQTRFFEGLSKKRWGTP